MIDTQTTGTTILTTTSLRIGDAFCIRLALFAGLVSFLAVPPIKAEEAMPPKPAATSREVTIPRTRQIDLDSRINHRTYRLFIAEPTGKAPSSGYPVIYLLDANAFFGTLVETARMQQRLVGPSVIVGVGYPTTVAFDSARRYYDFASFVAPDRLKAQLIPGQEAVSETGGNEEFIRVLQQEVKPLVEREFKIDRHRQTLLGHSLGSLFVLHVLFNHPDAFQTYVASSPSIWWDDCAILKEEQAFAARFGVNKSNRPTDNALLPRETGGTSNRGLDVRLLIAVGGIEQTPLPSDNHDRGERRKQNKMIDNARGMFDRLSQLSESGLSVAFKEFEGENHGSVAPCAISRAVAFALDGSVSQAKRPSDSTNNQTKH